MEVFELRGRLKKNLFPCLSNIYIYIYYTYTYTYTHTHTYIHTGNENNFLFVTNL